GRGHADPPRSVLTCHYRILHDVADPHHSVNLCVGELSCPGAHILPFDDIARLERAEALDRPAAVIRGVVQRLLRNRTLKDALHGVWLGHPLHPALAQVALGSLVSASLIDAVGGGRRGSSGLIAVGLASTVPTVAAGWADWSDWSDWSDSHEDQQRVGLVHAALNANATAVACFAASLLRRRGDRGTGRWLSLLGGTLSVTGRRCAATWTTGRPPAPTTVRRYHTSALETGRHSARWRSSRWAAGTQARRRRPGIRLASRRNHLRRHDALRPLPAPVRAAARG
ncbi:MAG: hypothetical protein ACRDOD_12515, partial [Streptosporangiaceae bacterium]